MSNFPRVPLPKDDMLRRNRMNRLHKTLKDKGYYVEPVPFDGKGEGWGYFIVSVDNPYEEAKR